MAVKAKAWKFKVEVYDVWWRLVARNGEILAHSEVYSTKAKAIKTAKLVAKGLRCQVEIKERA